jgi:hypothetical protein
VEDAEEGTARHEGGDDGQVWRLRARPHEQHHVGVLQPLHQRHLSPELLRDTKTGQPSADHADDSKVHSQMTC